MKTNPDKAYRDSLCEYITQLELAIRDNDSAIDRSKTMIQIMRDNAQSNKRQKKLNAKLLREAHMDLKKLQKK